MAELQHLKSKRSIIKGQLSRLLNFVEAFDENTSSFHEIETRLDKYRNLIDDFEQIQSEIESLPNQTTDEEERQVFEDKFFKTIGLARKISAKLQNPIILESDKNSNNSANQSMNQNPNFIVPSSIQPTVQSKVKLPSINLPDFHGHYNQWLTFHDTFNSLIHNDSNLSNVQKFYYLQSCLKNEAAQVIQALDISNDNYDIAWSMLKERYENKKLIIHTHIKTLFELSHMKNESFSQLRKLLDNFNKNIRALKSLGQPTDTWDTLLIYMLTSKIDTNSKREWEEHVKNNDNPTVKELNEFLSKHCQLLETIENKTHEKKSFSKTYNYEEKSLSHVSTKNISCSFCKQNHYNSNCDKFKSMSVSDRISEVKKQRLCYNCLRPNHSSRECKSSGCRICNKKHFTQLHLSEREQNDKLTAATVPAQVESAVTPNTSQPVTLTQTFGRSTRNKDIGVRQILLATALINICNHKNEMIQCRAMLDSGSQSSFITNDLAIKLKMQTKRVGIPVAGINNSLSTISSQTNLVFHSVDGKYSFEETFLIINKITEKLPQISFDISKWNIPSNVKLADKLFNVSDTIDVLLGANIFFKVLSSKQFTINENSPVLQETKLGWIVSGSMNLNSDVLSHQKTICHLSTTNVEIQNQLQKFWELEEVKSKHIYSKEEIECEEHFINTYKRDETGRIQVSLPLKSNYEQLGSSKENAINRFHYIEKRFAKNNEFKERYVSFMKEYEELGHMTQIDIENENTNAPVYYLPHHGVLKESSTTTKLRVVFDASCKTTTGLSLNDVLKVGPTIQPDLFVIALNFRKHNVVFTADIEKMYRQVLIAPENRDLQRIVWRDNPSEEIKHYRLNTITYGCASSSFLACRAVLQAAIDNEQKYPEASEMIKHCFYVDDLIGGAPSIEKAIMLKGQINQILLESNFPLRKWTSNKPEVVSDESLHHIDDIYVLPGNENVKTLGLVWNPNDDALMYNTTLIPFSAITKRIMLSTISRIFDPLGLIGPIIIRAKFLLQILWDAHIDWDELIPSNLRDAWLKFFAELNQLTSIKIPRHILISNYVKIQFHGFCDASELAYGACIYVRTTDTNGIHQSTLLCAKSKIAPLKKISLPHLELCGALLLARLMKKSKQALSMNNVDTTFWCDSSIVITWVSAQPCSWKTFVANRVTEIQELTEPYKWQHIPTKQNPADIISRGCYPKELANLNQWWYGPDFLKRNISDWPESKFETPEEIPDRRKEQKIVLHSCNNNSELYTDQSIFDKFSTFTKLHRVFTYVLRFLHNINPKGENKKLVGILTKPELNVALEILLKMSQSRHFSQEIATLTSGKMILNSSKLLSLNPFIDSSGLLRVGGRLKHSNLEYDTKYPILLPPKHPLTQKLIEYEHKRTLHSGAQAVLASLRNKYWVINGRNVVRGVIHKCIVCFRAKPSNVIPIMGNLPKSRLEPARPFLISGVDYAGPILVKDGRLRSRKIVKTYICIFVCFTTKAVHIELAGDLTSDSFLNCLKRFVSRRGLCSDLYSDNGSNFVGAKNDLESLIKDINKATLSGDFRDFILKNTITWHFNPPLSPNQGGLWEAAVKSAKKLLIREVGNAHLTFESLYTVLCQIEAVLNSRPLTALSSDPSDLTPLTPGHFLIGNSLVTIPQTDVSDKPAQRLDLYHRLQQMVQHFWQRWSAEYLTSLQQRNKWKRGDSNHVQIGDLVVLKEAGLPPLQWKLARVTALHPGSDNVIRVVTVKTSTGVFKRSVLNLSVLPVRDTEA